MISPTQGLDTAKAAQLSLSGPSIRSIALHAGVRRGAGRVPRRHGGETLRAAVGERAKLERPLGDAEIVGWS